MKIISWNVNGIRAIAKKNFFESLKTIDADIICIQETKAQDDQVSEVLNTIPEYLHYSNSADKKGYSGTAILCKTKPISITLDMGIDDHDHEGRILCTEFNDFFVISVYVPNSGNELKRLDYRQQWDLDFCNYLTRLEAQKPVVVCGDFNVAHTTMDLARPKPNYNKNAGFMQQEIDGMNRYINSNLVDSFRYMHPQLKDAYSWWSYRGSAKENNVGWRIDYILVSDCIKTRIKDAFILQEHDGSDHCPVGICL